MKLVEFGVDSDVQIGVFVKRLTVLLEQLNAYLRPDQTFLHLLLNDLLHPALQIIRKILNEGQDFLDGSALDDLLHEITHPARHRPHRHELR